MLQIHRLGKIFYCPLKKNRSADDSDGKYDYTAASELDWNTPELAQGKEVKLKDFPGAMKVKLFRVAVTTIGTEYIATNSLNQSSTDETHQICRVRWKIEKYHREVK